MATEHEDPILDACLAEVLGGHVPPDLTQRIMRAHAPAGSTENKVTMDRLVKVAVDPQPEVSLPVEILRIAPRKQPNEKVARQRFYWSAGMIVGMAAALLGTVVIIGIAARPKQPGPQIAANPAPSQPLKVATEPDVVREQTAVEQVATVPPPAAPAPEPIALEPVVSQPAVAASSASSKTPPLPVPTVSPPKVIVASGPPLNRERSSDATIVSFINDQFTQTWKDLGVRPTPAISDAEWCQRVFSRVVGRAPSASELKSLADDKSENRRDKLVHRLLNDQAFSEDFARHWSRILTQIFVGRGASAPNALASREDLQKYFESALSANKSYSQIVTDVLTASGSSRPGTDGYNPAVNFLLDGMAADATVPTARVARVLLGHQLQCAQCHNHPSQGWTQEHFWGLNASLRQVRVNRRDGAPKLLSIRRVTDPAVSYDAPDGQGRKATPHFIDGTELAGDGVTSGADVMSNLAKAVTQSDDFPRATVNRIWAQLFDYGFTRPLDDLGPKSTPTERDVFDRLAGEFAAHDFNLRELIEWSVLSEPFLRSSKLTDIASKDIPEAGETPLFSRFYARPARASDAFSLVTQAGRARTSGGSERDIVKARTDFLTQANRGSAKVSAKKATSSGSTNIVVKADEALQRAITVDPAGLVKKVAASKMSFDHKVEHLVLAVAGRQPTPRERRAAADLLRAAGDRESVALDDLWWSLQNSSDSIFDR